MNRRIRNVDWRGHGLTIARLALLGGGWMLTHGGQMLQNGGETLSAIGKAIRPKPKPEQRRLPSAFWNSSNGRHLIHCLQSSFPTCLTHSLNLNP